MAYDPENPFETFFETNIEGQRAAYGNATRGMKTSSRRSRLIDDLFNEARNQFLTELGTQFDMNNGVPERRWRQFLEQGPQQGGFDFARRVAEQAGNRNDPFYRPGNQPRTRFIFN